MMSHGSNLAAMCNSTSPPTRRIFLSPTCQRISLSVFVRFVPILFLLRSGAAADDARLSEFIGISLRAHAQPTSNALTTYIASAQSTPQINHIVLSGSSLLAQSENFLYISPDRGTTWQLKNFAPDSIVVLSDSLIFATATDSVMKSADGGKTWETVDTSPSVDPGEEDDSSSAAAPTLTALTSSSDTAFWDEQQQRQPVYRDGNNFRLYVSPMGTLFVLDDESLTSSADQGKTWRPVPLPNGRRCTPSNQFDVDGKILVIGCTSSSVFPGDGPVFFYKSEDGGRTWVELPKSFLERDSSVQNVFIHSNKIYAIDNNRLVRPTVSSWVELGSLREAVLNVATTSHSIIASTNKGLYRSSDGEEWRRIGEGGELAVAASEEQIVVFREPQGSAIYGAFSIDDGQSWTPLPTFPASDLIDVNLRNGFVSVRTSTSVYFLKIGRDMQWRRLQNVTPGLHASTLMSSGIDLLASAGDAILKSVEYSEVEFVLPARVVG